MSDSRKDLPSVSASNSLPRVREVLQGYLGTNGDLLNRGVTLRDLTDSGIIKVNPTYLVSGVGSPIAGPGRSVGSGSGTTTIVVPGGGSGPVYVPDYTRPPAPTGFFCGAGLSHLQGGIGDPSYTAGNGHAYSILYGVSYSGTGPLPLFADAVELIRFEGRMFAYPTNPATTWHLWVTHVSKDGVESLPTAGINGLTVTTGQDPALLLDVLSGQIDDTILTSGLKAKIDDASVTSGDAYDMSVTAWYATLWQGAAYTLRPMTTVDGRQVVGGFGLLGSDAGTQGATLDFGVLADRFWIGAPQEAGVTGVNSVKPFVVQTSDVTTANGVLIPKGVYMDAAYIKNLEALVARLGTAWINTAMIADAQIVDAHIQNLSADKINAGQLSAERIDGRGLVIKNEMNEVLLDATGDSAPPWVVNVLAEADADAFAVASPKDNTNRSRIRGLIVDGVNLKAGFSDTGRSIVIESTHREVWSVMYGADFPVYLVDGRIPLWKGSFKMEPNTAYTFQLELRGARVGTSTTGIPMRVYMRVPAGTRGEAHNGTTFDAIAGDDILVATLVNTGTPPALGSLPTTRVFVLSGPSGGEISLMAEVSNANQRLVAGTQFSAMRHLNYTNPPVYATRVGQVATLGDLPAYTSPLTSVVTGEPHQVEMDVLYDKSKAFISTTLGLWASSSIQARVTSRGTIVLVVGIGTSHTATPSDGTQPGLNDAQCFVCAYDIVTGAPAGEATRWSFEVTLDVVSSSWPEATDASAMRNPTSDEMPSAENYSIFRLPLVSQREGGTAVVANAATRHLGFGDAPVLSGTAVFDFFVQAYFMGVAVGPKQGIRVNLTVI